MRYNFKRTSNGHVERWSHDGSATGAALLIMALLSIPAAWATHVIWIITKLASGAGATGGQIALGIIGAFMPPVGIGHGYIIWFQAIFG